METKKQVAIWIRVSTQDQAQGESPEHHEMRARKYAELKEWEVVELYNLSGVSGKSVINHPEAQRMLQDIQSKRITGLIFSKLARLARNTRELLDFCDIFREYDADLISLSESIDTSTPAGRMFYTLISANAQFERETIADRVAASVPIRAELGKSLGGQAPYGYTFKNKKLILNEEEAPIRKLLFEMYLDCKRINTVARKASEQGYRTRKGAKFTGTTVERLLTDPIAKGLKRANYTKSLGEGKHWELKPEEEWVIQKVPAIVSEELWNQVNETIKQQKQGKKRRTRVNLFSGLAYCHCGPKMYVTTKTDKYVCETCRNKIPADDLEAIFHEELNGVLLDKEFTKNLVSNAQREIDEKEKLINQLETKRKELKEQIDQLFALHKIGQIPTNAFKEHHAPVYEQYEQITEQIPSIEQEIKSLVSKSNVSHSAIQEAQDIHKDWYQLTKEDKKKIIDIIVSKIIIEEDTITIHLLGLPKKKTNDDSGSNNGGSNGTHTKHNTNSKQESTTFFNPSQKLHASMPLRIFQPPRQAMCLWTRYGATLPF